MSIYEYKDRQARTNSWTKEGLDDSYLLNTGQRGRAVGKWHCCSNPTNVLRNCLKVLQKQFGLLTEYEEYYKSYLSSDDVHANDEEKEDG